LAPRLPRFFSEVVTTKRGEKGTFFLDTSDPNIVTKTRSLPISPALPPTLQPVVEAYRERKKFAEGN
jgi:hypothetical protein